MFSSDNGLTPNQKEENYFYSLSSNLMFFTACSFIPEAAFLFLSCCSSVFFSVFFFQKLLYAVFLLFKESIFQTLIIRFQFLIVGPY